MKTLLSVDIDFWNYRNNPEKSLKRYLSRLSHLSKERCVPIHAITNHQQILKWVNKSSARKIINIDTHSDLAWACVDRLNCGTWVNYVAWREEGSYHWVRNCSAYSGDCTGTIEIFKDGSKPLRYPARIGSAYKDLKPWDWKNISHSYGRLPKLENLDLTEIIVCESPSYSYRNLISIFHEWRKQNKIPYLKGRRNESFQLKVTPEQYERRKRR